MKIVATITLYISEHPQMIAHIEHAVRVKVCLLAGIAVYCLLFSYLDKRRKKREQALLLIKDGHFLS